MTYSKSRIDRAGTLLADGFQKIIKGKPVGTENLPAHFEAFDIVDWWRAEHAKPLSRVAANLGHYASQEGRPVVAQRLKKLPTIADKLGREPTMKLSRMADIGGVRAVVPSQVAAYKIASRLRKNWTVTKFRDYVAEPKPDGYRALHLVNRNHGRLIEIQLRTPLQDHWANGVETLSRLVAPGLKFGEGPPILAKHMRDFADVVATKDEGLISDEEFLAGAREFSHLPPGFLNEP